MNHRLSPFALEKSFLLPFCFFVSALVDVAVVVVIDFSFFSLFGFPPSLPISLYNTTWGANDDGIS